MSSYQATEPPNGATGTGQPVATYEITDAPNAKVCDSQSCGQTSIVRVIVPRDMADTSDPVTLDCCCLCWEQLRGQLIGRGHMIRDTTGDVDELRAQFHGVSFFRSDEGVLYASVNGCTYDAYLVSQLRAQLELVTVHVIA